jgi:hypothetical protein
MVVGLGAMFPGIILNIGEGDDVIGIDGCMVINEFDDIVDALEGWLLFRCLDLVEVFENSVGGASGSEPSVSDVSEVGEGDGEDVKRARFGLNIVVYACVVSACDR